MRMTNRTSIDTLFLVCFLVAPYPLSSALAQGPPTPPPAERAPTTLLGQLDEGCENVGERIAARVKSPSWTIPSTCKADTFEAEPCRKELTDQVREFLRTAAEEELSSLRRSILGTLESRGDLYSIQNLYEDLNDAFGDVEDRMEEVAEQAAAKSLADLSKDKATEAAEKATEAARSAAGQVDRVCREEAIDRIAGLRSLAIRGAEDALAVDLTKDTGFSPIVRCQWQRRPEGRDNLDCKPGLRVNGQDAAAILILPPSDDPYFGVSWAQTTTAEEAWRVASGSLLACPRHSPGDPRKLTCDEICFASGPACPDAEARVAGPALVEVAVHMPRRFGTSYGCASGKDELCALARLRGTNEGLLNREKLSLLITGKTPYVAIRAMDQYGRVASGTVLVGYERWRIETGGFLAVTPAVDEEVVTEKAEDGEVKVVEIREVDDVAQETGIFASFIPRNYESIGAGLGIATHDGEAPSVYLGPTVRLRSFGHRGLAAFTLGVVLRPVDRFPDLAEGNVVAADSSKLQPDSQFELHGFVGIQLGFSFGPISSAADD